MKKWTIDPVHSEISFKARHLMVSTIRGVFNKFEGHIEAPDENLDNANISFNAEVNSIDTRHGDRNGHLLSKDFFDAENFPKISFVSTSVKRIKNKLQVKGNLTIKDVTKPIEFEANVNGTNKGIEGKNVTGFDFTTKINRQDFGVTWNAILETGGVLISDDIDIEIFIEAQEEE